MAFAALLLLPAPPGLQPLAQRTGAVALLMAVWWMTEAIPLAATSLLPLVLFPMLGVLSVADAAAPYANPVIFLFMSGFILALSMERWGLHRRVALVVLARVGTSPRRLVLGVMLATAAVSLWVSNTATAAMMLPVGLALARRLQPAGEAPFPFGTALMLGIAYASTIGGVGTLIGTPPNGVFAAASRELVGREVAFVEWMMIGMPVVAVLLPAAWALLVYVQHPPGAITAGADGLIQSERQSLGSIRRGELITIVVFGVTVVGWLSTALVPGIDDATIGMAGALLLFVLPVDWRRRGGRCSSLAAGSPWPTRSSRAVSPSRWVSWWAASAQCRDGCCWGSSARHSFT